jgi:hypothetical protein
VNLFRAKRILAASGAVGVLGACLALASEASACDSPPKPGDPVITKISIVPPTVINVAAAPGQLKIAVTYTVGPSGLDSISYQFSSASTSQSFFGNAAFGDVAPGSGTVYLLPLNASFDIGDGYNGGFNLYSAPGLWSLYQIYITDVANHCAYYAGSALNAFAPLPTVNVVNKGSPDTKQPTISAAKILTPTVTRSAAYPFVRLDMAVADDVSGVLNVAAYFRNASDDYIFANSDSVAPVHKGMMVVGERLASSTPTGTYTVTYVEVCNVAGACYSVSDENQLKKLFEDKTSFKVTP